MYRQDAAPDRSILVTAFSGQLFGIDRASGEIRWAVGANTFGYGVLEIAFEGGVVIVASRTQLGFVDYLTGQVHAVVDIEGDHPRRPTMIVDNGQVLIARDGEVTCFTTRGDRVWYQPFKGKGIGVTAIGLPGNVRQADDVGSK